MAEMTLARKLGIKPGYRMLVMNAPEGYEGALGALPEGAEVGTKPEGSFDFVQVFVKSKAEVDSMAPVGIGALEPGGLIWFCYPKKSSKIKTDIHRDAGWEAVTAAGLEGVSLISLDETWSAMRFRPRSEIKARQGRG